MSEVPYFPGPDEWPAPWEPEPKVPLRDQVREWALTVTTCSAVLVLLGAPAALLWRALTPKVPTVTTASGPALTAGSGHALFGIDVWFVVTTALVGLAAGVVGWRLLRDRGPAGPAGLAAGGLLAALVARAVGGRLVADPVVYDFCHSGGRTCGTYDGTLVLQATAAVVALPVGLLVAFVVLTLIFDRAEL